MNTCKTCRHWKPYLDERDDSSAKDDEKAGGFCHCEKLTEDHWQGHKSDMLIYPYQEGCKAFWTGPDFGCVHHIPNDTAGE